MPKSEMYRQYARQCLLLAEMAETPERRAFLVEMAQAWHGRAEEIDGLVFGRLVVRASRE
jgi:hypothetical protein